MALTSTEPSSALPSQSLIAALVPDEVAVTRAPSRALALVPEFGPLHALAEVAHHSYIDGFSTRAVAQCRQWVCVADAAGDRTTSLYLHYVEAIALQELDEHRAAVAAAQALLHTLGEEPEPAWRAKALSLVAESSNHLGEHSVSIAAMAEADWLLLDIPSESYGHLSASMAVALAMRSAHLVEQSEVALAAITRHNEPELQLLVVQETALLSAYWATALLTLGRKDEAAAHLLRTASRATRMRQLAQTTSHSSMQARADVIEAYALLHLGEPDLAFSLSLIHI